MRKLLRGFLINQRGLTLIDVTLATLILGIAVVLLVMTMTKGSMRSSGETQSMQGLCRAQAQNVLEEIKSYGAGLGYVRYNPASGEIECRSGQAKDCPTPDFLSRESLWGDAGQNRSMKPVDYNAATGKYSYRPYLLQLSYMNNLTALYNSQGPSICTVGIDAAGLTNLTTGLKRESDKEFYQFEEAHQRTVIRIEPIRYSGRSFAGDQRCPQSLFVRPPTSAALPEVNFELALKSVLGLESGEYDLGQKRIQGSYDDVEFRVTIATFYRDPFERDENGNAPERSCEVQQTFNHPQQRPPIVVTFSPSNDVDIITQCVDPLRLENRTITVNLSKPGSLLLCRDRTQLIPASPGGIPICNVPGCPRINFPSTAAVPEIAVGSWLPCAAITPTCVGSFSTRIPDGESSDGIASVEFQFNEIARGCQILVDILEVDGAMSFGAGDPSAQPYMLTKDDLKTIQIEGRQQERGLFVCNVNDLTGDTCFNEEYICVPETGNPIATCESQFNCSGNDDNRCCCEKTGGNWAGGRCCRDTSNATCCNASGGIWDPVTRQCRVPTEDEPGCTDGDTRETFSCQGLDWQAVQQVCRDGNWTVERYPRGADCGRSGQCPAGQVPICQANENGCGCVSPSGSGGGRPSP